MMIIRKFNERWDDSTYDPEWDDEMHNGNKEDGEEEEDGDFDTEEENNMTYLIRTTFRNQRIDDVEVEINKGDISIFCQIGKKVRLDEIISIFDVVYLLKKDILSQYESEFELWETKSGSPILVYNFFYDDVVSDNGKLPF